MKLKKNVRRRYRVKLLAIIAQSLIRGLPLPPDAIEWAKRQGQGPFPTLPGVFPPKSKAYPQNHRRHKTAGKSFYQTAEWKAVRYQVLKAANGRCGACGVSAADGARMNVDHIKPISKHWDLRLDRNNLQVLCSSCNWGKSNKDETDWRVSEPVSEFQDHMNAIKHER